MAPPNKRVRRGADPQIVFLGNIPKFFRFEQAQHKGFFGINMFARLKNGTRHIDMCRWNGEVDYQINVA